MNGAVSEIWKYRLQKLEHLHKLVRREINNEFRLRCARRTCDNHIFKLKQALYPILELEKRATEMAHSMAILQQRYSCLETRWGYTRIQKDAAELRSRIGTVLEEETDQTKPQPDSELGFLLVQNNLLLRKTNQARKIRKQGCYKRLEKIFDLQPFFHHPRVRNAKAA